MIATYYHPHVLSVGRPPAHVRYCAMRGHLHETAVVTLPNGRTVRFVVLDQCRRRGVIDIPAHEFRHRFGPKAMHAGRVKVRVMFLRRRKHSRGV